MVVDALAPYIAKLSTAIALNMKDKLHIAFQGVGFIIAFVVSLSRYVLTYKYKFMSPKYIKNDKG